MTANADVTTSSPNAAVATVTTTAAGDGSGTVWADGVAPGDPSNTNCTSNPCAVQYQVGSTVHLTATSGTARFTGYSGTGDAAVCGSSPSCTFTVTGDTSVTATFAALTSFTVTPSSAIGVPGGTTQQFTATGTYSDAVTAAISNGTGAWTSAPALPFTNESLASVALGGKVYAVGGRGFSFDPTSAHGAVFAFDPATQTWTARASMLTRRENLAAVTASGQLYAIGGNNATIVSSNVVTVTLASAERYDPASDAWTARASMSAPRSSLAAGTIDGIIYAAGGAGAAGAPVATLEAYDPASDTWTQKAPMPTARSYVAGGAIDGLFYVVGGYDGTSTVSTVDAYDPATNTWTPRAPLPVPLAAAGSAVADGVLYVAGGNYFGVSVVYAYDPIGNAWTAKAPLRIPRIAPSLAGLNGIVYAIGGASTTFVFCCNKTTSTVEAFADSLHWSSSAPAVARVDATGVATPLTPGTASIVASVGGTTCGGSCPVFTVLPPTRLSLDLPVNHSVISGSSTFTIGGWALNPGAPSGTGVDALHAYALPASGPAVFLGVAAYGEPRPDVGAVFGSQFTNSGFLLQNQSLAPGSYTIAVSAHNAFTGAFDAIATADLTVTATVSNPAIAVDTPAPSQTVTSAFEVAGWALDAGAPTGTGVDAVQFYMQPQGQPAPGVFVGSGSYGAARGDVAAVYGARFTNVGFHFTITGMSPGAYTLNVYARSTATGTYSILSAVPLTVNATALMSIDTPRPEALITIRGFGLGGWAIDRSIESTLQSGTGVDAIHVYAYPNPGSGEPPIFLGVATLGLGRPDVGAAYGTRYNPAGYSFIVDADALGLAPGVYNIAVIAHSSVSGTFNNLAVVRITLQ